MFMITQGGRDWSIILMGGAFLRPDFGWLVGRVMCS